MYDVLYMDTAGVVGAEVEIRFDTRRGGLFGRGEERGDTRVEIRSRV